LNVECDFSFHVLIISSERLPSCNSSPRMGSSASARFVHPGLIAFVFSLSAISSRELLLFTAVVDISLYQDSTVRGMLRRKDNMVVRNLFVNSLLSFRYLFSSPPPPSCLILLPCPAGLSLQQGILRTAEADTLRITLHNLNIRRLGRMARAPTTSHQGMHTALRFRIPMASPHMVVYCSLLFIS
jgi:hypothetical protein